MEDVNNRKNPVPVFTLGAEESGHVVEMQQNARKPADSANSVRRFQVSLHNYLFLVRETSFCPL